MTAISSIEEARSLCVHPHDICDTATEVPSRTSTENDRPSVMFRTTAQPSTPKPWAELVDPYPPVQVDLVGCPGKVTLSPLRDDFRRGLVSHVWPKIEQVLKDSGVGGLSPPRLEASGHRVRYHAPPVGGGELIEVDVDAIILKSEDLAFANEAKRVIDRSGCMINTWWSSFDFRLFVQAVPKPHVSVWDRFLGRG